MDFEHRTGDRVKGTFKCRWSGGPEERYEVELEREEAERLLRNPYAVLAAAHKARTSGRP